MNHLTAQRGATKVIALVLILCSVCQKGSFSFGIPTSLPLPTAVSAAQAAVVVRIVSFTTSPGYSPPLPNRSMVIGGKVIQFYSGVDAMYEADTLNPPGTYQLDVEETLKGRCPKSLSLSLPAILSDYYDNQRFNVKVGTQALLLLRLNAQNEWECVDPTLPLVPLANVTGTSQPDVVSVLLDSLENTEASQRQIYTFLLRDSVGPQVVIGLARYVDDPNVKVQDNVLYCLAQNQQIAAIPRIEALAEQTAGEQIGLICPMALESYKDTPEARPLLNRLLFCPEYFTRLHTMFALDHLADRTSIPYLMLALRDPDTQNIIPQSAYGLLHQLNPSLGLAYGSDYFAQHHAVEMQKLDAWWSNRLLGKQLKPGEHPDVPAILPATPALLDPLLFVPDIVTRRAAVARLAHIGDASCIPYLILALQDPDAQQPDVSVAYVAYKTLHRLIPALGPALGSDAFAADHDAATQPIYEWWTDELMGKHLMGKHLTAQNP